MKAVPEQLRATTHGKTPEEIRNEKIRRYRRDEQITNTLKELQKLQSDEDTDEDSEVVRKSLLLAIEQHSIKAADALNSLIQEEQIVNHMANLVTEKGYLPPPEKQVPRVSYLLLILMLSLGPSSTTHCH